MVFGPVGRRKGWASAFVSSSSIRAPSNHPANSESAQPKAIIAIARRQRAYYKCPKSVYFVESLPRNATGKVLPKKLRETVARLPGQ